MKKLAFAFILTMAAIWVDATFAMPITPVAPKAKVGVREPVENVDKFWNSLDWNNMSSDEQILWTVLGWDAKKWHGNKAQEPASENKNWADLSKIEQEAATKLGYDQKSWDAN